MSALTSTETAQVLLDLAVIVGAGSALAALAVRWRQPAVIGEIVAGILLGPTLLGALPGHLSVRLFPAGDRPFLSMLADVGLVMFMFGVGFELDHGYIRQFRSSVAAVSLGALALPFGLGAGLAVLLYPANDVVAGHHVGKSSFVLFLGVAMSITAFPVLARILTGFGLHRSRLGAFVMACAAGADVLAWAMLALVVAIVAGHGGLSTLRLLGEMVIFAAVLALVVRPVCRRVLMHRLVRARSGSLPFVLIVTGLLASAWFTTRLGFQPIFGGFAFGAVMPRDAVSRVAPEIPLLIEKVAQLLVPVFFVVTGLSVNLTGLGGQGLLEIVLVLLVACTGKFFGATGGARLSGLDTRRSCAVGVLMNTRGLTELVVIEVGATLGILTGRLVSVMVVMAVVTTVVATPLFRRLYTADLQREDGVTRPLVPVVPGMPAAPAPVPEQAPAPARERDGRPRLVVAEPAGQPADRPG